MTSSLLYNTGTVSLATGSATVTGSGTGWAVALVTGGLFSSGGMSIPIAIVDSDTSLTLAYAWPGATAAGLAYAIARDTSEATRAAWTNDRLATIIQRLSLVGIHPDGAGTIAERNALNPVPAIGYLWLYAEAGHDLAIYRKVAAGWDGPFALRGSAATIGDVAGLTAALAAKAPAGNYLKDAQFNVLSDSGRFTGSADKGIVVGAFAFPAYLATANGTTVADGGKFISNNNDYGGSAGALPPMVKDLVDKIRALAYRRYGPEFRLAQMTMGALTTAPLVLGGNTYYLTTYFQQYPRFPSQTFHFYIRVLDAPVVVNKEGAQQVYLREGVVTAAPFVVSPADGWVSVTVQDATDPYNSYGYIPRPLMLFAGSAGNRYLLACPALLPGITSVNDNVGVVPGINIYL